MEDKIIKGIDVPKWEPSKEFMEENIDKGCDTPLDDITNELSIINPFKLAAVLRLFGTAILLSAALMFMFKDWHDYTHPQMYLSFLASTMIMGAAGFFCGLKIKDSKSARVLLMIVTALVPMHFAQLGGFIISVTGKLRNVIPYPTAFVWQTDSVQTVILLALATLVVILPILFVAFSTLFRSKAKFLTCLYLGLNTMLLIPFREIGWVILLSVIMLAVLIYSLFNQLWNETANKTLEGKIVNILLFVPLFILIGRAYYVKLFTVFFTGIFFEFLAAALFAFAKKFDEEDSSASLLHCIATWLAVLGSWFIESDLSRTSYDILIYMLPASVITAISGIFAPKNKSQYISNACYIALASTFIQVFDVSDEFTRIMALLASITTIYYSCLSNIDKNKTLLICSLIQFSIVFLMELICMAQENSIWHWGVLSAIGLIIIVSASFFEKKLTKETDKKIEE